VLQMNSGNESGKGIEYHGRWTGVYIGAPDIGDSVDCG
jgi:hypothetical protein